MSGYLHGSDRETSRLFEQAAYLRQWFAPHWTLPDSGTVLEVGCGVGAQTAWLLEQHPALQFHCIDANPDQIEIARTTLQPFVAQGRATIDCLDVVDIAPNHQFDGALFIWVLEHVPDALEALVASGRALKPGAGICCTEVLNSSFHHCPASQPLTHYWEQFNELQRHLGGDPDVGSRLPALLAEAGFREIQVQPVSLFFSDHHPDARREIFSYWSTLLASAAPGLQEAGKIGGAELSEMVAACAELGSRAGSVLSYTAMVASARIQ